MSVEASLLLFCPRFECSVQVGGQAQHQPDQYFSHGYSIHRFGAILPLWCYNDTSMALHWGWAMRLVDVTGRRFGRLVVVEKVGGVGSGDPHWRCRCDCGNDSLVTTHNLIVGATVSCGCFQRERASAANKRHGMAWTPSWRVWVAMRARCENPKHAVWKYYGGRGIKVCDRWRTFENFYADMGDRPDGMSIDRVDVNGDYEPGNCRWATRAQQRFNQRPRARKEMPQ